MRTMQGKEWAAWAFGPGWSNIWVFPLKPDPNWGFGAGVAGGMMHTRYTPGVQLHQPGPEIMLR